MQTTFRLGIKIYYFLNLFDSEETVLEWRDEK